MSLKKQLPNAVYTQNSTFTEDEYKTMIDVLVEESDNDMIIHRNNDDAIIFLLTNTGTEAIGDFDKTYCRIFCLKLNAKWNENRVWLNLNEKQYCEISNWFSGHELVKSISENEGIEGVTDLHIDVRQGSSNSENFVEELKAKYEEAKNVIVAMSKSVVDYKQDLSDLSQAHDELLNKLSIKTPQAEDRTGVPKYPLEAVKKVSPLLIENQEGGKHKLFSVEYSINDETGWALKYLWFNTFDNDGFMVGNVRVSAHDAVRLANFIHLCFSEPMMFVQGLGTIKPLPTGVKSPFKFDFGGRASIELPDVTEKMGTCLGKLDIVRQKFKEFETEGTPYADQVEKFRKINVELYEYLRQQQINYNELKSRLSNMLQAYDELSEKLDKQDFNPVSSMSLVKMFKSEDELREALFDAYNKNDALGKTVLDCKKKLKETEKYAKTVEQHASDSKTRVLELEEAMSAFDAELKKQKERADKYYQLYKNCQTASHGEDAAEYLASKILEKKGKRLEAMVDFGSLKEGGFTVQPEINRVHFDVERCNIIAKIPYGQSDLLNVYTDVGVPIAQSSKRVEEIRQIVSKWHPNTIISVMVEPYIR